jgi:hypothetical protein
LLAA